MISEAQALAVTQEFAQIIRDAGIEIVERVVAHRERTFITIWTVVDNPASFEERQPIYAAEWELLERHMDMKIDLKLLKRYGHPIHTRVTLPDDAIWIDPFVHCEMMGPSETADAVRRFGI
jgi:hypothetical protein